VQRRNLSFDLSLTASLRETRCIKAELAATKAQETNLEEQIKKLHRVRLDLDLMCDNEKTSLKEQDRETVRFIIKRKCLFFKTFRPVLGSPVQ
jgi:hypothetical protein